MHHENIELHKKLEIIRQDNVDLQNKVHEHDNVLYPYSATFLVN